MTEPHNTPLERQLQKNLNQMEQNLSPELSRRLYKARRAAITQAERPSTRPKYFKPILAASVVSLFVVVMLFYSPQPMPVDDILTNGAKDTELISSQDDLELYQELEFYRWLAVADHG